MSILKQGLWGHVNLKIPSYGIGNPIMKIKWFHDYVIFMMWICPDSKIHQANMGPTWVLSVPDGPYVGPMNLVIRVHILKDSLYIETGPYRTLLFVELVL